MGAIPCARMSETLNQENGLFESNWSTNLTTTHFPFLSLREAVHPHPPKRATLPFPGELRIEMSDFGRQINF